MSSTRQRLRKVVFERLASGRWMASIPSIKGCLAGGRTIDEARRRVTRAATMKLGRDPGELAETIMLPSSAQRALRESHSARERAEEARRDAHEAIERAVSVLTRTLGLSVRDASELMGLSHQRVHQVGSEAKAADTGGPAGSRRARR